MAYPIHTQSQDCHHESPAETMEELIIQVLMLKLSAIQKPTKFHAFHCRRSGSTGLRSWLVSISWDVVRPGSWSTASLSAHRRSLAPLLVSIAVGGVYLPLMSPVSMRRKRNKSDRSK